jgi:hypothetical protein
MVTYLRFRKAMHHHNMMDALPLRTKLQPYATYFALFIITILTLTNGFQGKIKLKFTSILIHSKPNLYPNSFLPLPLEALRFPRRLHHNPDLPRAISRS